jgi:hypothetical protein
MNEQPLSHEFRWRLDAQWEAVAILEGLPADAGATSLRAWLQAQANHARSTLAPLERWSTVPERVYKVSTAPPNHVRARRLIDYVRTGERIIDIGTNYGYISGIVIRERGPAHYTGLDLGQHQLDSVAQLVEELGLQVPSLELRLRNVYDLTHSEIAAADPSLVIMSEVLEHVDDAEAALKRVGEALPATSALLFTVPLLGRHETCWGHRSIFDGSRVKAMCDDASLSVLAVEVVYNSWLFVLAAPDPASHSERLRALGDAYWPSALMPRLDRHRLERIKPELFTLGERWTRNLSSPPEQAAGRTGLLVRGHADDSAEKSYLSISFRVPGFELLRLQMRIAATAMEAAFVDLFDDSGRRTGRWRWRPGNPSVDRKPFTLALRKGQDAGDFVELISADSARTRVVEVFLQLESRSQAELELVQAALVPVRSRGASPS